MNARPSGPVSPLARGARLLSLALALGLALGAGCATSEVRPAAQPDHPLLARGEQAMLAGDDDEALRCYRSYREGFGEGALVSEACYWEGTILLKKGRVGEAERLFQEAIARPRSSWFAAAAWVGVGDCRFTVDDYKGAAQAYQRSLDLAVPDARNDYALYRLGVARQRSGDWEAGKACYQIVVRDYAKSALVTRAEQRLRYPDRALHFQVGAFQSAEGARSLEEQLHARGIIARTVNITGGPAPYLVWVGEYGSIAQAQGALPEVKALCGEGVVLVP